MLGDMPSGLVHQQRAVFARRDASGDPRQVQVHRLVLHQGSTSLAVAPVSRDTPPIAAACVRVASS